MESSNRSGLFFNLSAVFAANFLFLASICSFGFLLDKIATSDAERKPFNRIKPRIMHISDIIAHRMGCVVSYNICNDSFVFVK